jgi:hypothetical protein
MALDLAGASAQSAVVLVASFTLAIAGALIAIRGLVEFIGERV